MGLGGKAQWVLPDAGDTQGDVAFDNVGHHSHARAGAHAADKAPHAFFFHQFLDDGLGFVGLIAIIAHVIIDFAAVDATRVIDHFEI